MQRVLVILAMIGIIFVNYSSQTFAAGKIDFEKEKQDFLYYVKTNQKIAFTEKINHLDSIFQRVTSRFAEGGKTEVLYNDSIGKAFKEIKELLEFWDDVFEEAIELKTHNKIDKEIIKGLEEKQKKIKYYKSEWLKFLGQN